jgi:hypothetical protein
LFCKKKPGNFHFLERYSQKKCKWWICTIKSFFSIFLSTGLEPVQVSFGWASQFMTFSDLVDERDISVQRFGARQSIRLVMKWSSIPSLSSQ